VYGEKVILITFLFVLGNLWVIAPSSTANPNDDVINPNDAIPV
jgi:hypothetical protein